MAYYMGGREHKDVCNFEHMSPRGDSGHRSGTSISFVKFQGIRYDDRKPCKDTGDHKLAWYHKLLGIPLGKG